MLVRDKRRFFEDVNGCYRDGYESSWPSEYCARPENVLNRLSDPIVVRNDSDHLPDLYSRLDAALEGILPRSRVLMP